MSKIINYRQAVFSNLPPKLTNVLWIYPIDSKHFDVRIYTTVQEDEFTVVKKWTSLGISDLEETNLTTESWYVGSIEEFPNLDISFVEKEIEDLFIENSEIEDIIFSPIYLLSSLIYKLKEKQVYFDTSYINPEEPGYKYYAVVIPSDYRVNSITKENYYEKTKTFKQDFLVSGNYKFYNALETNGKQYKVILVEFDPQETPYQITTTVIKDLSVESIITQETGRSINKVMSQQAVTKELDVLKDILSNVDVPNLATVAKTGDYNDLLNKPEIPSTEGLASIANVEQSLIQSKFYTDQQLSNIEFPEPVKKLSQLENDTNFAEGISIVTIHNDEWVDNPETERWFYVTDTNALLLTINPNERVIIDSPTSLSGIYIVPNNGSEVESATYELVFKTSDNAFGIGTLEEIQWAKEPVFNANKTYAVNIELNKTSEGTTIGLAMYAEFNTLNMEG